MSKMVHILYGDNGEIISASESKKTARPAHTSVKVGEFEVPVKFTQKKIHEYIPLLVVDTTASRLKEK